MRRYPSQVVCCNFEEVTEDDDNLELEVLMNSDVAGIAKNYYVCSVKEKRILSQCVQFLKHVTEGKQLFIVVKGKGRYIHLF